MRSLRHLPVLLIVLAAASPAPSELVIVTDEADAAIHILESRQAGRAVTEASWRRLFATEGYRRLKARETAMGRSFEDSSFRAFLLSDTLLPRTAALRETLRGWRNADLDIAGAKALAYLPGGTRLRARVYLLIKPRSNSFVFEAETDPAIMLYLDPTRTRDQLGNTIAHELHHIGYAAACTSSNDSTADPAVATAREWLGAFGEGVAMLAAAGGPDVHPHAASPAEDRLRWDRDVANSAADLRRLESFFLDILDHRLTDPDSTRQAAMSHPTVYHGPCTPKNVMAAWRDIPRCRAGRRLCSRGWASNPGPAFEKLENRGTEATENRWCAVPQQLFSVSSVASVPLF